MRGRKRIEDIEIRREGESKIQREVKRREGESKRNRFKRLL